MPIPSQFAIPTGGDHCTGVTLNPNDTCTVSVDFTATAVGNVTGALKFTSNASNSPHSISLTGTGIAGLIHLSPSIVFPDTVVGGTSAPKTATLSNPNPVALDVYEVYTSANFGIPAVTDKCSGTTLTAKGSGATSSCTVGVTFAPTAQGTRTGTLTVDSNARNSGATIALTGAGKLLAPTLSSKTLAFGKVNVGLPKTLSVTVTNPNNISLDFGTASVSGGVYQISGDTCSGNSIGAGDLCTISVTFTPTAKPAVTGTLSVVDNAGTGTPPTTTQTVTLTGSGK